MRNWTVNVSEKNSNTLTRHLREYKGLMYQPILSTIIPPTQPILVQALLPLQVILFFSRRQPHTKQKKNQVAPSEFYVLQ